MSGARNIKFRWPWGYVWSAVAIALPVIMLSDDLTGWDAEQTKHAIRWWLRTFVSLEMLGAWLNSRDNDGVEEIRTLSQLLQYIGAVDEAKAKWERWWKGWPAMVTMYVVTLSVAAGWAFWGVGPAIGGVYVESLVIAPGVFCWLLYHFLRRYRYG